MTLLNNGSRRLKILLASPIYSDSIQRLKRGHQLEHAVGSPRTELKRKIQGAEVLIFRSGVEVDAGLLARASDLRLLIRAGSGLDNIDMEFVRDKGIHLVRIPRPGAQAVAEMSFALMLALYRNILQADQSMRLAQWKKYELEGSLLHRKTLGVVGLGNIGSRVAEMGVAWEMDVIGCVEKPSIQRAEAFRTKGITLMELEEVAAHADVISIHVPLQETTWNLIDADLIKRMKKDAILVNLSRGGVVDEHALADALRSEQQLRAAALDVHLEEGEGMRSPLADLENTILTPHIGAMAIDAQREIGLEIERIVDRLAVGEIADLETRKLETT